MNRAWIPVLVLAALAIFPDSGSTVVTSSDSPHDILLRLFFMKSIMMY